MSADRLPLSRLIMAVTAELRKAEELARRAREGEEGARPVMQFAECELEMGVEIETKGEAETNIWVFKLGGGVTKTDANTVRVKFTSIPGNALMYKMDVAGPGPALG